MEDELAALGLGDWGGDGDLSPAFIRRMRLVLAEALDLRRVERIDLGAALALVLQRDLSSKAKQRVEASLERRIACDLAFDVRMTRPSRVRTNLSARRARLN